MIAALGVLRKPNTLCTSMDVPNQHDRHPWTPGESTLEALISVITMIATSAASTALTFSHGRGPVKYNAYSFLAGTRPLSTKFIAPIVEALCLE